jgi:hypothetical protein
MSEWVSENENCFKVMRKVSWQLINLQAKSLYEMHCVEHSINQSNFKSISSISIYIYKRFYFLFISRKCIEICLHKVSEWVSEWDEHMINQFEY